MLIKYTTIKYYVSGWVYHLQSIKKRVVCDCNRCSSSSHSHESQFLSPVKTNENVFLSNKKKNRRKEKQTMEEQKKNYARIACLTYSTSSSCLLLLFLLLLVVVLLLLVAAVLNLRKMAQRNKLKCSKSRRRCRASFHSATSYHTHTHTGAGEEEGEGGAVCGSMSWHDCNDNKVTLLSAAQQKTSEKK